MSFGGTPALCFWGVGLDTQVSLLVAALDLNLVRLLRGAVRAADAGAARAGGVIGSSSANSPRPVLHPASRIEPRPVVHPTPRIEPRPVIQPAPAETAEPEPCLYTSPCLGVAPLNRAGFVLQPPWKLLPWKDRRPDPVRVKVLIRRPDILHKGTLLDSFL